MEKAVCENILQKKRNIIAKMIDTNIDFIINNINNILNDKDFYKLGIITYLIEKIKDVQRGQKILIDKFDLFLKNAYEDEVISLLETVSELDCGRAIINKKFKEITNKIDVEEIVDVVGFLNECDENDIVEKNKYVYGLYEKGLIDEDILGCIIKSDMSEFTRLMIEEISDGKEIYRLARGTYSVVLEVNNYIVKLGETREKYEIPYHPNIIQPLLREAIMDESGKIIFVAEIQPKVDTKNVTKQHIEKVKRILENDGIKYFDYDKDSLENPNIGILKSKNKRYLNKNVGGIIYSGKIQEIELPEGEPVIIDTDLIYENDR